MDVEDADRTPPINPTARPILLVVDDDTVVRQILASSFRRQGWDVWLAGDGAEAAALLRARPGRTAVVLVEGPLPGLRGPDTLRQAQAWPAGARLCFLRGQESQRPTRGGAVVYANAADLAGLIGEEPSSDVTAA